MENGRQRILFASSVAQEPGEAAANLDLMRELSSRGHEVGLLASNGDSFSTEAGRQGIATTVARNRPDLLNALRRMARGPHADDRPGAVILLGFQECEWLAGLCCKLGIPVLCLVADTRPFILRLHRDPLFPGNLSAVLTRTTRYNSFLTNRFGGSIRVVTIPDGLDDSFLETIGNEESPSPVLHRQPGMLNIGVSGPEDNKTSHLEFMRCAGKVLDRGVSCIFAILGNHGSEHCRELRFRISVDRMLRESTCWMSLDPSCSPLLRTFDLALASAGEGDSFCREALLWMASGVPLVARRSPVLEDIVEDGVSGYLAEPDCPERMAEMVVRLARDPHLLGGMSAAARRRIRRNFTLGAAADRLLELITDLSVSGTKRSRQ